MTEKPLSEVLDHLKSTRVKYEDFKFLSTIGSGATSEVFQALHIKSGIVCAVKQFKFTEMDASEQKTFTREVKILQKCRNYFLLPYYGVSFEHPYVIVTKYIKRGNLRDALHKNILSPTNKYLIAYCVAYAMNYLHGHGVVHRDLKSVNILLDGKLLPHICDFGLSRIESKNNLMTAKIGTPTWMAPEALLGEGYTNKVDVYSFGILLWELFTEEVPFKGKQPAELAIMVSQRGERPKIPSNMPEILKTLIQHCWAQDPEKRPTFTEITATLQKNRNWFPGTDSNDVDKFFEVFDIYEVKGKRGSPFAAGNDKKGNPKKRRNLQKKRKSVGGPKSAQVGADDEEEEMNEPSFAIPDLRISETDFDVHSLYMSKKIKTNKKRLPRASTMSLAFGFEDVPDAIEEPSVSTFNLEDENDNEASPFLGFIPPAEITVEDVDFDEEESDDGTVRKRKPLKIPHLQAPSGDASVYNFPGHIMLEPKDISVDTVPHAVPLIFQTVAGDTAPTVGDIPLSPFAEKLQISTPLPDPDTLKDGEGRSIPQPSVFVPPKPTKFDENGQKVNIFLEMEASAGRAKTSFGNTNVDILLDFKRPSFEQTLVRTISCLTRGTAKDFFSIVSELFMPPVPLYICRKTLRLCLRCLQLNEKAWRPFAKSDAPQNLPFCTKCLFDLSCKIFLFVIPHNPDSFTVEVADKILAMAKYKVHQTMRVFSAYTSSIGFIHDPYPVLDRMLECAALINKYGGGLELVRILMGLLENTVFKAKRLDTVRIILQDLVYTHIPQQAAEALSALCTIDKVPATLPSDILAVHIKYRATAPYVISYLAQLGKPPLDQPIVKGIVKAAKGNEAAQFLLCAAAESEEGAKVLSKNTTWMDDQTMPLDNTVRLFAIVFKFIELRESLAASERFPSFLSRLAMSSNLKMLPMAGSILGKIRLSFSLVERLRSADFLGRFFAIAVERATPEALRACIIVARDVAAVEYCSEFGCVIAGFGLFIDARGDYIDDALEFAVRATRFPEGVLAFKKLDLEAIFANSYVCERSWDNKETLFSRIR